MQLDHRFNARFTDSIQIGPVDGGVRVDNYFDGEMTEGALAGARVRGVDQVRIRDDGSAVLDIRETIETGAGTIAADVRGYALPTPTTTPRSPPLMAWKRRGWDSNPRCTGYAHNGFRDRPIQPLSHPSGSASGG